MKEKELRVESEVSDDCAQPLGINVRVTRRCCDALVSQKRLERDLETEETVRYSDTDKPKGSEHSYG